jgi:hypothetical protein
LITGAASTVLAGSDERMDRQIRVFEKALDTMLVDSPNWLVRNSEPTHGYYVGDHGAVFSFRASLVSWWDDDHGPWWRWWKDRDDDDRDWDEVVSRQERKYERGKKEIVESLLDFGEVLSSLDDDDWVEISVKLRDAAYFRENDLRRLEMQIKMRDLRAFYEGRTGEKEVIDKIQIKEE